jgi:AraC-like DNA-binding protein
MDLIYARAKENDVDYIIAMLSYLYPVSKKLQKEFKKHAVEVKLQQEDHVLLQGGICKYMYFIKSGAVMGYTYHQDKEIITYITVENEFVSSLSGLYGEQPSREAIKAIEPTVLLGVHTDILLGWYDKFFDLNFIIRKVYEIYYRDAQERSHIIRVGDAKERYLYFSKTREAAVERLPIPILAAFLNMKPATLIKLKKDLKKGGTTDESEILLEMLIDSLVSNQSFRNNKLTAQVLAKDNKISVKKLNSCIKNNLQKSFKDFINSYRIAYFKELVIQDKNLKMFTIEAMALQAGFTSKSSFYLAYKKQEGTNPSYSK